MIDTNTQNAHEILNKRRESAETEVSIRKQQLLASEPEFANTELDLVKFGSESIKCAISKNTARAEELKKIINDLSEKQADFLESHGYGRNYLKPKYVCQKCNDTGMVLLPDGREEKCSCYRQIILDAWRQESGLSSLKAEFNSFDLSLYPDEANKEKYDLDISPRKNAENNLKICKKFAENFSFDSKDLLFIGRPGTGKTFTCNCIAESLIKADIPVMYITAYKLFNVIVAYNTTDEEREKSRITDDLVRRTPVLIIDDLGAENITESRKSALLDILNERESNNVSFPCKTIISSNLALPELYKCYGERIGSRILGRFKVLSFIGEDIRLM